ncbi:S8 family serine peptidase [Paraburkholderia kururiensis]|uniref:S8 family serine peptidase n=1 Tax=Paraburkholderia kururiensis TaxID=984307 RepID=UPI000F8622AF|nr:S8 family serine peptidase [Paraburkholderia kururiensis]
MKKFLPRILGAGLIFAWLVIFSSYGYSQTAIGRSIIVPGDYLIRRNPGASVDQTLLSAEKTLGRPVKLVEDLGTDDLMRIRVSPEKPFPKGRELISVTKRDTFALASVGAAVEPVVEYRLTQSVSDVTVTKAQIQKTMTRVNMAASQELNFHASGNPIVVAVIDTGLMESHEVFAGLLLPGVDVTTNKNSAAAVKLTDGSIETHGTTTSGIVAMMIRGGTVDHAPVANIKILPIRATSSVANDQRISSPDLIKAIDYAIKHGARVINASFGDAGGSNEVKLKLDQADAMNIVVCAAAGNGLRVSLDKLPAGYDIDATPFYPASYRLPNVIGVSALDTTDVLASFSNWGKKSVMIAAPGEGVLSATPLVGNDGKVSSGYQAQVGTSIATPFVSGAVALLLSTRPDMKPDQVSSLVVSTATHKNALKNRIASEGELSTASLLAPTAAQSANNIKIASVGGGGLTISDALATPVTSQKIASIAPILKGVDAGGDHSATPTWTQFLVRADPSVMRTLAKKVDLLSPTASPIGKVDKIDKNLFAVDVDGLLGSKAAEAALKNVKGVQNVEPAVSYQIQNMQ